MKLFPWLKLLLIRYPDLQGAKKHINLCWLGYQQKSRFCQSEHLKSRGSKSTSRQKHRKRVVIQSWDTITEPLQALGECGDKLRIVASRDMEELEEWRLELCIGGSEHWSVGAERRDASWGKNAPRLFQGTLEGESAMSSQNGKWPLSRKLKIVGLMPLLLNTKDSRE